MTSNEQFLDSLGISYFYRAINKGLAAKPNFDNTWVVLDTAAWPLYEVNRLYAKCNTRQVKVLIARHQIVHQTEHHNWTFSLSAF